MKLLTAGEFAELARTTKRTILFYDQKGILKPAEVNSANYRYYKSEQIIDFQVILLLRKLNFSIEEIKKYLSKNKSLKETFKAKRDAVEKEIKHLQRALKDIDEYYKNLESTGTLVKPTIKEVPAFEIYYIQKIGQYAKIKEYCLELKSMFKVIPKDAVYLTIFEEDGYNPKNANMKIGVIVSDEIEIKKDFANIVKKELIPDYKALSYVHNGSSKLLSLLWKGLGKYMKDNHMKSDPKVPYDRELYYKTSLNEAEDEDDYIFEIQRAVESSKPEYRNTKQVKSKK